MNRRAWTKIISFRRGRQVIFFLFLCKSKNVLRPVVPSRIRPLYLCRSVRPPTNVLCIILNDLGVRLQFWSLGEFGVFFHCYYSSGLIVPVRVSSLGQNGMFYHYWQIQTTKQKHYCIVWNEPPHALASMSTHTKRNICAIIKQVTSPH